MELAYACPASDAGSRIRITAGDASVETTLPAAPALEIQLEHRDDDGKTRYRNRDWAHLKIGTLKLPKGPARLTVQALTLTGSQVMDFKLVKLRRLDP